MTGSELDRLVLREVFRAEESVRVAVTHAARMLQRRGYGPLEPRFPLNSNLASFSVHSCYLTRRIEHRSRSAALSMFSDPKIHRRVEIGLAQNIAVCPLETANTVEETDESPAKRDDSVCVLACNLDVKPGVVELKGFHEILEELKACRAVILVQDKMTTPAKKMQRSTHSTMPIEVFRYAELLFDRVQSQVVPRCVPLDGRAALLELFVHFERFHEDDNDPKTLTRAAALLKDRLAVDPGYESRLNDRKRKELKRYFSSDQVSRYLGLEEDELLLVRTCNYGEEPKLELRVVCKPVQTTVSKASAS